MSRLVQFDLTQHDRTAVGDRKSVVNIDFHDWVLSTCKLCIADYKTTCTKAGLHYLICLELMTFEHLSYHVSAQTTPLSFATLH